MAIPDISLLPRNNGALADIYHNMAACYRYLGKNARAVSYDKAAVIIRHLREDISSCIQPGNMMQEAVTADMRRDIREFLRTGTLRQYIRLSRKVPVSLLQVMEVKGFGPAIVKILHEQLKVNNIEELRMAVLSGKLEHVKGISAGKAEHLKRSLKLYKTAGSRLLLWEAMLAGNELLKVLRQLPEVEEASFSGSLRRGTETVGDIDIVLKVPAQQRQKLVQQVMKLPQVRSLVASGWKRISAVLHNNAQVDIRLADRQSYGAALLYYTGSPEHVSLLKDRAEKRGYLLTEEGLFETEMGAYAAGRTENEIYERLGLACIPPELREGGREIFLAGRHRLPELVLFDQMNGDMRACTVHGQEGTTLDAVAHYVVNAFPHYEYLVIADRLPQDSYTARFAAIDKINDTLGFPFLKKGITVNIQRDGSLDMPDALLRHFDWVTAVTDAAEGEDCTERLLKACDHPQVDCIGNPGGRVIGREKACIVDWSRLFERAAATATALEINAQPDRMDLWDRQVKKAVEAGVYIVISSCAQQLNQFDYMQVGVKIARRAWCKKENILNTLSWKDVETFRRSRDNALDAQQQHLETEKK